MANPILRQKLAAGEFLIVPGVQDMIATVITKKVGFDIIYGTGFWLTASSLGLPDAGIATFTQMVDRMRTVVRTSDAALIADADTGYGGLLNVQPGTLAVTGQLQRKESALGTVSLLVRRGAVTYSRMVPGGE